LQSAQEKIVGEWRSADDLKSVITFASDGTTSDVYDGEKLNVGAWYMVHKIDDSREKYNPTGIFLYTNSKGEEFVYAVVEISDETLTLSYLARGNTLTYTRINSEEEFNVSGRAKAYGEDVDTWQEYSDDESGLTFKYPQNVLLTTVPYKKDGFRLVVESTDVSDITEGTLGFDKETVLKNKKALAGGSYGSGVDMALSTSKILRKVGNIYAQDFIVLGRFEVCDVTFERKLYFFNGEKQIMITLYGPENIIMSQLSEYFTKDAQNCFEETIWDFTKQDDFYTVLKNKKAGGAAQEWFDVFDRIIDSIVVK
jgi:hypothetical protein